MNFTIPDNDECLLKLHRDDANDIEKHRNAPDIHFFVCVVASGGFYCLFKNHQPFLNQQEILMQINATWCEIFNTLVKFMSSETYDCLISLYKAESNKEGVLKGNFRILKIIQAAKNQEISFFIKSRSMEKYEVSDPKATYI